MKKSIGLIILILCLFATNLCPATFVNADSFKENTLIYTYYNNEAELYGDLTGITHFSINDKYIAYTLDNTSVSIINRITKQKYLNTELDIELTNISNITLTKNYLFVVDNQKLKAFSLGTFTETPIYIDSASTTLPAYKSYSIAEDNNKIAIACINDHNFVTYSYNPKTLSILSTYINVSINSQSTAITMLNIATSTTHAYIINNSTNYENLWKVDYNNANPEFTKAYFPKSDINALQVYTHNDTDYLLAIEDSNNLHVIRTDLQYNNPEYDYTDQTRNGIVTNSDYTVNTIDTPQDIAISNNNVYISDSNLKCIQEFKFNLNQDQKGTLTGTEIVISSHCGESGRFNYNSNLEYNNNILTIADPNNKRIQIISNGEVLVLNNTKFPSISADILSNLKIANKINDKIYFTTYNDDNSHQYIFEYDINTNILQSIPHIVVGKIIDSTTYNGNIYYISTHGLYALECSTNNTVALNNTNYSENSRITATFNKLAIANNQDIIITNTNGSVISTTTTNFAITDIESTSDTIFALSMSDNKLISFALTNDNSVTQKSNIDIAFSKTTYSSITIDKASGTIYLFDNVNCKIDRLINPNFNYLAKKGVFQVNNKNVSVYARPYFLNGIDTPQILQTLNVNTRINIYSTNSVNYGNIEYYIMELNDGSYGYINKDDLTYLSEVVNYEVILPNASLRTFDDSEMINIYKDSSLDSEIIATTPTNTRVHIVEESNDFTLIRYYDDNQNIIEGYVESSLVNQDALTSSQITALILIGCSIVLLIAILITIRIIQKRNAKKALEN